MKILALAAAACMAALSVVGCADQPVQRVYVPGPEDQTAYRPVPAQKPMPPEGYIPGPQQPPPGYPQGQMPPQGQPPMGAAPTIRNEEPFVQAYVARRSPKIMVFVNRTIQGDPLSPDALQQVIQTGSYAGNGSTSVQTNPSQADWVGATSTDYQMMEASIIRYLDNSGKVTVQDSDAARAHLNRETVLRIENGDPAAARLLASEMQQDVLIRVTASPTRHAASGQPEVRLIAKAVSTTDARILANAFVDMPLPMSKTNINYYTGYLSSELMGQMAQKWLQPNADPITVRVYKTATVDDALKVRKWLQATQGVTEVRTNGATGGSQSAISSFAVAFNGAPEDLYGNLKDAIGQSQGLKAVDLQNNTINLEVTGPMNLVTTTRRSDTTTITETRTVEDRRIEPITPAPVQPIQPIDPAQPH